MVMCAHLIWKLANKQRYHCKCCDYFTHNKALFTRHSATITHWLHDVFAQAPRDIKIIVASFLPYRKIRKCGKVVIDAFNYMLPNHSVWKIKSMDPANPPFQNDVVVVNLVRNSRNRVYAERLL